MQQKSSHTFVQSKMNKDLDARLISSGEYRDGVNVAVSRSESADVGALENIIGNLQVIPFSKTGGAVSPKQVIGWYFDTSNDRVFVYITDYQDNSVDFLSNSAPPGSDCRIVYCDLKTNLSTTIVEGSWLNFSINSPINNSNMIENLLFWTDNRNQPRKINVDTALADTSYYENEDHVSVAKYYPFQTLDLVNEYRFDNDMVLVDKFNNGDLLNSNEGYTAIYDFLIFNTDPPQNIIDKLTNNIGVKGYIETSGTTTAGNEPQRFEFRVAWFQKDGYRSKQNDNNGPKRLPVHLSGTSWDGKYMLFLDRQLRVKPSTSPGDSNAGFFKTDIQTLDSDVYTYTMVLTEESSKNVSEPWDSDCIAKVQLEGYNSGGANVNKKYYILDQPTDSSLQGYCSQLFQFGTRSRLVDLSDDFAATVTAPTTPVAEYDNRFLPPGEQSFPPFKIYNGFPENTGEASNIYPRIKHPKLPTDRIFVIYESIFFVDNPVDVPFTINSSVGIEIRELLSTGGQNNLLSVNLAKDFGIRKFDVLEIYMPNKYYNQNFPGDPVFLKNKFIRFAYRFKFDDGEYSVISPFTQNVFVPKQKGYFLTNVGRGPIDSNPGALDINGVPSDVVDSSQKVNSPIHQSQLAGQSTEVEWFTNSITEVNIRIPLEYKASELKDRLKVDQIDILYKESDGLSLKVVETLDIKDYSSVDDNYIDYTYQSRKPIKTLPADEIGRVYDQVPIRAMTQSTSGNRIIYGNFYDRHSSPLTLNYEVGISSKFTPSYPNTTNSDIKYPNHTLKQNRNYQVGLVLSDRYGRSTDVVLSSVEDTSVVIKDGLYDSNRITFGGSTIYSPYFDSVLNLFDIQEKQNPTLQSQIIDKPNPRAGIVDWPGDSIKLRFPEQIPDVINGLQGYPGLYSFPLSAPNGNSASVELAEGTEKNKLYLTPNANMSINDIVNIYSVGTVVKWYINGVEYQASITAVDYSDQIFPFLIIYLDGENIVSDDFPDEGDNIFPFSPIKDLGFYSYRVVVKQNEQSYSNVYLPSLLKGNPVVKPYQLFILANPIKNNILTLDQNKLATPATFPVLEGQIIKVVTSYEGGTGAYLLDLNTNIAGEGYVLNGQYALQNAGGTQSGFIRVVEVGEDGSILDFVITNPGEGYTVGDTITAQNISGSTVPAITTAAQFDVLSVYNTNYEEVAVINVLNNDQIEVSKAVTVAGFNNNTETGDTTEGESIEHEFTSPDSGVTMNATTLLTDNANKVPPSLNETTPVQQQYSTSDTQLIPRVALNDKTGETNTTYSSYPVNTTPPVLPNVPRTPTGDWAFPIYPGKETLKVRAIGDFESMFIDGKYNGLWQADTNPPTCTIDNRFNLGRDAQTALPIGKEYYQAAIYETTPTVSQLEIFFETSTSGKLEDLNNLILLNS